MSGIVAALHLALTSSPLMPIALTLAAYLVGVALFRRSGGHPLASPVLVAVVLIVSLLMAGDVPYPSYFDGARPIHWLLGPATVSLALPLYAQLKRIHSLLLPLATALLAGSASVIVSALAIAKWLGATPVTLASLAPKSATSPIAMAIAERTGGIAALAASIVLITGLVGVVSFRWLLDRLSIEDDSIRGFALGLAAHGVGSARAFQVSETCGAFAALAMSLNGALTAILVPLLLPLFS